jgi:hypothetical protein
MEMEGQEMDSTTTELPPPKEPNRMGEDDTSNTQSSLPADRPGR